MKKGFDKLDEYLLADYLSGDLSREDRISISSHLVDDPSARELVAMAGDALEAATGSKTADGKRSGGAKQRPPFQSVNQRWLIRMVSILSIVTIGLTVALLIQVLKESIPGENASLPNLAVDWTPVLRSDHFSLTWSAVDGADMYVVIIMDPTSEHLVRRIETSSTSLRDVFQRPDNESGLPDHLIPRSGEILDLWITAFDKRGRLLRRSERIPFTAES